MPKIRLPKLARQNAAHRKGVAAVSCIRIILLMVCTAALRTSTAQAAGPEIRRIWMERSQVPSGYSSSGGKTVAYVGYRLWIDVRNDSGAKPMPDEILVRVAEKNADGSWGNDNRLQSFLYQDSSGKIDSNRSFLSFNYNYSPGNLQKCVTKSLRVTAYQEPNLATREAEFTFGNCDNLDPGAIISLVKNQTSSVDVSAATADAPSLSDPAITPGPLSPGEPRLIVADVKVKFAPRETFGGVIPALDFLITTKNIGTDAAVLRNMKGTLNLRILVNGRHCGRGPLLSPGATSKLKLLPRQSVETHWIFSDETADFLKIGENLFSFFIEETRDKPQDAFEFKYIVEPCRQFGDTESSASGVTMFGGAMYNECRGNVLKYRCENDLIVGRGSEDCKNGCKQGRCITLPQSSSPYQAGDFREGEQVHPFEVALSDTAFFYAGTPRDETTILVFFSQNCEACESALDFVQLLYTEYALRGLLAVGIYTDPTRRIENFHESRVWRDHYAKKRLLSFPIGLEWGGSRPFVGSSPAIVLLDTDGKILFVADRQRLLSPHSIMKEFLNRTRKAIGIDEDEPIAPAIVNFLAGAKTPKELESADAGSESVVKLLAAVKAELTAGHYRRAVGALFERKGVTLTDDLREKETAALAAALFEAAGAYDVAGTLRKNYTVKEFSQQPDSIVVSAGTQAWVKSSSLNFRTEPRSDAPVAARLYINTPVTVRAMDGEWARVRLESSIKRGMVIGVFGAENRVKRSTYFLPATQKSIEGYVAAGFLDTMPQNASALKAQAKAALDAGNADQAATLYERAAALNPTDTDALAGAVNAGIDANRFALAAKAALTLAGPGAPLAPGLEVEEIHLAYGCRGDLAQAVFVKPPFPDVTSGRLPVNSCAEKINAWEPCPVCAFEDGDSQNNSELQSRDQEINAFRARVARFNAIYPSNPFLYVRLKNRKATESLPETKLYVYTADVVSGCDELGGPGIPLGIDVAEIKIPALKPIETLDLWVAVPEYSGKHYGILAARRQSAQELKEFLARLQWGDPKAFHGIAVDGMPPRRGLVTASDPCGCCD